MVENNTKISCRRNLNLGVSKTHILLFCLILLLASIITTGSPAASFAHHLVAGEFKSMCPRLLSSSWPVLITLVSTFGFRLGKAHADVDLGWYPPRNTAINDLETALHGAGIYGFIFNSSHTPDAVYGIYNWCNMPHVRKREYVKAEVGYRLRYVEMIQRHHKRTPYASNAFPVESYHWDCDDQGLYYYGAPFGGDDNNSSNSNNSNNSNNNSKNAKKHPAAGFWRGLISPVNPYMPAGWIGTCQFPQLTAAGLDDAYVHGEDIYDVYHGLLGFFPSRHEDWRSKVVYRVTQNVITSQVAGMLIGGTWGTGDSVPLLIEAAGIDSLEPQYPCSVGNKLFNEIKSASDPAWKAHLDGAADLYRVLDDISGVSPSDVGFHASFDHYFDNLSARQCHEKPLPCKLVNGVSTSPCIDQALAEAVYRLGQWEYSRIYRDAPRALEASASSYGVWIAELAAHIRAVIKGEDMPLYIHNVAHDGSVSRLLSILQIDIMVWPGMGSEIVFELYDQACLAGPSGPSKKSPGEYYVRVLFGGQVLQSSNPSLGVLDMVPAETLLMYFDGLVGKNADLVMAKCNGTIST